MFNIYNGIAIFRILLITYEREPGVIGGIIGAKEQVTRGGATITITATTIPANPTTAYYATGNGIVWGGGLLATGRVLRVTRIQTFSIKSPYSLLDQAPGLQQFLEEMVRVVSSAEVFGEGAAPAPFGAPPVLLMMETTMTGLGLADTARGVRMESPVVAIVLLFPVSSG